MAIQQASFVAWAALAGAVLAPSLSGCISSEPASESRGEDKRINQIQLQEHLQRFTGVFADRMIQAAEPLADWSMPKRTRMQAMLQVLRYDAAVLDITTGRFPEANLLDMLAFMALTRAVLDEYWLPEVFGEAGRPLADSFARSEEDLKRLAQKLLTPAQMGEVQALVQAWRKDNPGQHRVESVRLFSFAETAGRLADEREEKASGLLSSLTAATQAADQAMLFAERSLFLAQRMPSVVRLQVRIATQEVTDEALAALDRTDAPLHQANDLAARTAQALGDARELAAVLQPLLQPSDGRAPLPVERLLARTSQVVDDSHKLLRELEGVERVLSSADRVTNRSGILVKDVRGLLPAQEDGIDALLRRGVLYGAALGTLLVSLFWVGYIVVSRRLTRDGDRGRRDRSPPPPARHAAAGARASGEVP